MNTPDLYHEKQRLQYCLIHTLNNILQKRVFTVENINEICYSYDNSRWFNAHKSWIGLGNYDANVLMGALQQQDLKTIWFDKRIPVSNIQLEFVKAIVFNIPSRSLVPFVKGRHWFPLLQIDQKFYNLDSKLDNPDIVVDVTEFIKHNVENQDIEVMFVVSKDVSEESVIKK